MKKSANAPGGIDPSVWKVALVAVIGPFMTQLDSTVVNVSLSTISHTLDSSIATAQWIISGYLLAMALMLPLNGWLVDCIGAKRLYIIGFATFTLASILCGASRTMGELICARVFQGLVGGVLAPMTQMMIARVAGKNMARVMGYTALPILLGPILGPVLAGTILGVSTWSWLFYLNVPVGILGVGLAFLLLPGDAISTKAPVRFPRFRADFTWPRCAHLRASKCVAHRGTMGSARRRRVSCGILAARETQGQFRADRCADLCRPDFLRRCRHAIFRQRHFVWPATCRSFVPDRRLWVARRACGLDHRVDGCRHDVLVSTSGIHDRKIWLPRSLGGRCVAGFPEHDHVPLDDRTSVLGCVGRGQPFPGRGGSRNDQHTVDIGSLFIDPESAACRREHRVEHCTKGWRSSCDHAPGRGDFVDDAQAGERSATAIPDGLCDALLFSLVGFRGGNASSATNTSRI